VSKSAVGMAARPAVAGPSYSELVQATVAQRRLADTFVDTTCDPPRVFTFGGIIGHVTTFGAVRRTLVPGALESAGITDLGAGDPMHVLDPVS
jgi:AraC family transcriptional regulator